MAEIVLRTSKGSALTHEEVDSNFHNLNEAKLEGGIFATNNSLLIRDKDGNLVAAVINELRVVGRLTDGNIKGLTMTELKELLALEIDSVAGLAEALLEKAQQDEVDDLSGDVADLEGAVDDLQAALGGLTVFAHGTEPLVAGEVAVAVVGMLSTDYVVIGRYAAGGTLGALYTTGSEAGGFMAKSTSVEDTSIIYYVVYRPAV